MVELGVLEDVAVLIGDDGHVAAVAPHAELMTRARDAEVQEVDGVLFPGFVDCHTHAVFGMARLVDHDRRSRGVGYKEIAAAGGGILSSVRDVRERSYEELADLTRRRLDHLLALGSTTVEVKSGYGLSLEAELKQLDVIAAMAADAGPQIVPTFLGAHEVPQEYRPRADEYVELVVHEMLPAVERHGAARFCDVFCEPGVFTVEQSRRVLEAAARHGMRAKLHADELDPSGGAELAAALGAASADHLAAISDGGIAALAGSDTVAVLLPGTMMFLGQRRQAPGRRLIDAGAAVALATDFNPGSSPGMSLPLMATMAASQCGMVPAETITAITVNGAAAVGEAHTRGQIAPGFRADLVLAAVRDWRELVYWYGDNLVSEVWLGGSACHPRRGPVNLLV
jgi:imidazolonepropionase